jgi:hypothetical protein
MHGQSLVVIVAVVPTLALAFGGDAHASFNRQHASSCFGGITGPALVSGAWQDQNYSIYNSAQPVRGENDGFAELTCPVPDTDATPKYAWTTVNVETYIGAGAYSPYSSVNAAICEDYWNGSGGACTNIGVGTLGGGHQTISLGSSVSSIWSSSGEANFGYVYLLVGSNSDVRGIYCAN